MTNEKIKIEPYNKQPADNSFLYHYITIDKLLDFLFNGRIPLVKLTEFEDKLEGTDIYHLLWNLEGEKASKELKANGGTLAHITVNVFPETRNKYRDKREIFQKTNFATCWFESNHESVAMWHLYSKPDSIAIKIPYSVISTALLNYNFTINNPEIVRLRFGSIDYHVFNDLEKLRSIKKKKYPRFH